MGDLPQFGSAVLISVAWCDDFGCIEFFDLKKNGEGESDQKTQTIHLN